MHLLLWKTSEFKRWWTLRRLVTWGWRDLAVKSTGCSSRGPKFYSQHPCNSSQLTVTPVQRDPTPSSGCHGHCTLVVQRHACRQNTHTLNIFFFKEKVENLSKTMWLVIGPATPDGGVTLSTLSFRLVAWTCGLWGASLIGIRQHILGKEWKK